MVHPIQKEITTRLKDWIQKIADKRKGIQKQYFDDSHLPIYNALRGLPFWINDPIEHQKAWQQSAIENRCCKNHALGLPKKWGKHLPIFDYEIDLIQQLEQYRNLVINKSRGLGITEILCRYIIGVCTDAEEWRGRRIVIVTGPDIDLSYDIINRIKNIIRTNFPTVSFGKLESKRQKSIEFCGITIEAFPSRNIESLRGYTDVLMIVLDECDRFPKFTQMAVKYNVEGYRLKNNPYTVWLSTPEDPSGLLARYAKEIAELEKMGLPTYKYLVLNYKLGIGKIYDPAQIEAEKLKRYFPKEYDNKFAGAEGNLFNREDVRACVDDSYDPNVWYPETFKLLGVDQSGGIGISGIVIYELRADGIYVLHADDYENKRYSELLDIVMLLAKNVGGVDYFYADAAYHPFYAKIKNELDEPDDPKYIAEELARARDNQIPIEKLMRVIPRSGRDRIIWNAQISLALENRYLHIHSKFDKYITALESATGDDKGKLDKIVTSFDDVLDAGSFPMPFFKIPVKAHREVGTADGRI